MTFFIMKISIMALGVITLSKMYNIANFKNQTLRLLYLSIKVPLIGMRV
jgi:hypothetical protein